MFHIPIFCVPNLLPLEINAGLNVTCMCTIVYQNCEFQVILRHFYSILHVTEFRDTLSYVAATMSDKRSFEQLLCHPHSRSFAYNRLFAQMSLHYCQHSNTLQDFLANIIFSLHPFKSWSPSLANFFFVIFFFTKYLPDSLTKTHQWLIARLSASDYVFLNQVIVFLLVFKIYFF